MNILTLVIVAGATLTFAAYLLLRFSRQIARLSDAFVRLPASQKVVLILGVTIATVSAQKGGTNDVDGTSDGGTNAPPLLQFVLPPSTPAVAISSNDVLRGYRLESVSLNPDVTYAMPDGAAVVGTWHLTGAYEDVVRVGIREQGLGISGWSFPLGTHLCDYLWAYTWGMARPQLKNVSNEIAAVGAPMSAIPDVSRFWTAATTNGSRLLTWENFVEGRSLLASSNTPTTISAQLELYPTGDFIARSNNVESVYRRVNPDDWDDDGIPNEEDPDPLLYGGNHFGPNQEIPEGDDSNHYCWVELVVRQANARVTFEGEGGSWMPDPSFIAKAGETNCVLLLIGKTYAVHCDMPVEVVNRSDEDIETWEAEGVLMIEWPVWFEYVSTMPLLMASPLLTSESGSSGTTIRVYPACMGGGSYSWADDFCCYSFAADGTPVFDCKGNCGCGGGCYTGEVTYECSGHQFSFGGWSCGCHEPSDDDEPHDDDEDPEDPPAGPSISASFSSKAIIFEDAYTNAPGQVIGWRSASSEVTCSAYGGTNGISYSFTIEGADDKLLRVAGAHFPLTGTLAAGKSFERRITYKAIAPSGSTNDIVVTAEYTENGTGHQEHKEETAVAVKVFVEAAASFPVNKSRHVFGPQEVFQVKTVPGGYGPVNCTAPISQGGSNVSIDIENVNYSVGIAVVHPLLAFRGEFVREMTAGDWTSIGKDPLYPNVSGAGFVARWYLQPDYVSFAEIEVCEGDAPVSGRWGCFTDLIAYPSSVYAHTPRAGAGVGIGIGYGNIISGDDCVGVQLGVPPATDGGYGLVIPWSWGVIGGPYVYHFGALQQTVSVTSNGGTTISKGNLSTTRGVNQ